MADWDLKTAVDMWNNGSSAKEIAKEFGVTKNTVIGRVHRAREKGMWVKQKANPSKPKGPSIRRPKFFPKIVENAEKMLSPNTELTIYDLKPGQCKYSIGENEFHEYIFCGKATLRSYCDEHHALCHTVKAAEKPKQMPGTDIKRKFLHYR